MRRRLLAGVCSAGMAAMLCAGMAITGYAEESGEPTTLVWWKFNDEEVIDTQLERWNEEHPDKQIELDIQKYSLDELVSKLQMSLSTGAGMPDIADVEISSLGIFMNGTEDDIQFFPLDKYVEAEADALQMQRMAQYYFADHYYGVDINCGTSVAYYNTELLDAVGINYEDIVTYDDYVEAGRKYYEATGKPWTVFEVTTNNMLYALIAQHGGDYFDEDGNITLNSETNVETFTWMQDLIKEGVATTAPGGACTAEEFITFFTDGGCASVIMPSWFTLQMYYTMPDLAGKMAIAPMPLWEEDGYTGAGIGGTSTMVYKNSENAELAAEFICDGRISHQGALEIGEILGMDPVRLDVYDELAADSTIFTKTFLVNDFFEAISAAQENVAKQNYNTYYPYLEDLLGETVCYAIFVDMKDVQTVLDEGAASLQQTIDNLE